MNKLTLLTVAKGVAMGAADVVPGVSGGTIALLTGIYPRLINAITQFNSIAIKQLLTGDIKGFWQAIDGNFVLPLLIGIAFAFALLAHPIKYALNHTPVPMWSFFFGLIIASSILIIAHIKDKKILQYLWIIPGIALGFYIGSLSSIPFPSSQIAIFVAGMIAICAMILPGISGSFILLLLGMYEVLITAVSNREMLVLLIFIAGAIIGLLLFSRVIKWVLDRFYNITLFFLSGLMLGSLIKVWPWKLAMHDVVKLQNHKQTLINVMPNNYPNAQLITALSIMSAAIFIVFFVDYLGQKFKNKN